MSEYALRLANGSDTAARVRAADALGMTPNGAVRARGGLRPDGGGAVTVVAGTMSVQVTPFSCWVDASPAGQVGYPFVCDAAKTLAIAAGDATLVRVDTVAVVVKENAFDGTGATTATLQIVQGTPGAGAPAMPTSACIPLRDINVPAGASAGSGGLSAGALSTDRRVYTTAVGGILPVASADPAGSYEGQAIFRRDTDKLRLFDGTTWRDAAQAGMPAAVIRSTAGLSIPNGTATRIDMAETVKAQDMTVDLATDRLTVTLGGVYLIAARAGLQSAVTAGDMTLEVRVNGLASNTPARAVQKFAGGWPLVNGVGFAVLAPGDYLEAWITQTTGASQTMGADDNWRAYLSAVRIA